MRMLPLTRLTSHTAVRHCEERSDEAIQKDAAVVRDCVASLAMTARVARPRTDHGVEQGA
jgi:hypothetical protein